MPQARDDQPAHRAGVAEPDLGFGGVDVHINKRRVAVDKERRHRVPITRQHVHISGAQGPQQHLVAHRAPVDEKELRHRRPARIGWQGGIACEVKSFALGIDTQRILGKILAQDIAQPAMKCVKQIAGFTICAENRTTVAL